MKIGKDDCYSKVKKSKNVQSNADIFDGDTTSSNFDVMLDNLRHYNSVNRDNVILKLCEFTSIHKAYLLAKFHNDRRRRTC